MKMASKKLEGGRGEGFKGNQTCRRRRRRAVGSWMNTRPLHLFTLHPGSFSHAILVTTTTTSVVTAHTWECKVYRFICEQILPIAILFTLSNRSSSWLLLNKKFFNTLSLSHRLSVSLSLSVCVCLCVCVTRLKVAYVRAECLQAICY